MSNFPATWQIMSHREMITEQGIMQESEAQKVPLGAKLELADGRTFRYCKAGAVALAAGKMTGSPIVASERDDAINAAAAVAIGATSLVFTAVGTVVENSLDMLHVVNDTGEGLQYKIKSNKGATAGNDFTIILYDPIVTALAATTDCIVTVSMWADIILTPDDVIFPTGVPTIPVTALYYYWSQTGGIAMCLAGSSTGVATDERVMRMDVAAGVDGAIDCATGTLAGTQTVGHVLFDSTDHVDTEYWPVVLSIN